MYASLGHELPPDDGWTFEPKYDGMRVIGEAKERAVRLVTRNGKDKHTQFPEVVDALREFAGRAKRTLVIDGEIIARPRRRSAKGTAVGTFQRLQSRMHLKQ